MFTWLKRQKQTHSNLLKHSIKYVDQLPDNELKILNNLLPWASYMNDSLGRRFGKPFSSKKRSSSEKIPDPRIVELNRRYPLRNLRVLELGCFEGNHTVGLSQFSDHVTAIDSRIEHIVKTIIRTAMFDYRPHVFRLDLEQPFPNDPTLMFDVLHHVGVLYHLSDPVTHLHEILPRCRIIMLDTHIATDNDSLDSYTVQNTIYRYKRFRESGRAAPFAGMQNHAKWLLEKDIISILKFHGFDNIEITEYRDERNGKRILLYAHNKQQFDND